MNADERAVKHVLSQYEAALNASDASAVMLLYADDGVFLPQHFQPGVGTAEIRRTYDSVFGTIQLSVKFKVQEILQLSPFWAIARTRSNGTVKEHATGKSRKEANQELFLFQKVEGTWKIARYAFSTTSPATA